jgi:hypothetical protein
LAREQVVADELRVVQPGLDDAIVALTGRSLLPILLVFTLALTATMSVPSTLATYRHQGVLRRLRTTPVGPAPLLAAQLVANLLFAIVAAALTIGVAVGVFDVAPPASWSASAVARARGVGAVLHRADHRRGSVQPDRSAGPRRLGVDPPDGARRPVVPT